MARQSTKTGIAALDKTLHHKSKSIRNGKYALLIFLASLISHSCQIKPSEIRIIFVGDILLSRNVKAEYHSRSSSPWEHLKTCFHSADLVIGNLEGAVGSSQNQINTAHEAPVFSIDSCDISMLADAGFKYITIENNHIFDLGETGKLNTAAMLLKNDIFPVSFENSPQFIKVKDVVLAIVAVNMVPNRACSKNILPSVELKQKLRLAKSLANIVIVTIHWGSEFLPWPNKEQRQAAQWLIANGVDIIIGCHPHVIQNPEIIKGKPVFFSLGNHLFDQKYPDTKKGLMVEISIRKGKYHCAGIKTRTRPNSFYPEIDTYVDFKLEPIEYNRKLLTIKDYTIKPLSMTGSQDHKIALQAYQDEKKIWTSHPMALVLISAKKLDGENEYLFTLEKYYSSLDQEINIRPYVYDTDGNGIFARWRGSALAWPLIDAQISPMNDQILCALHRGDSFINLDKTTTSTRIAAYEWNGFGFTGLSDSTACKYCRDVFE